MMSLSDVKATLSFSDGSPTMGLKSQQFAESRCHPSVLQSFVLGLGQLFFHQSKTSLSLLTRLTTRTLISALNAAHNVGCSGCPSK